MSKKQKLKKTLVEQILDKAKIEHTGLAINALESNSLPEDISRSDIYKTLALIGDKTGPVIGILPLTEHLSEKKLAKVSGNKKSKHDSSKRLAKKRQVIFTVQIILWGFGKIKKFPIFIDSIALEHDFIVCSAGEVGRSIKIAPKVLADFVHAQFVEIRE